MPSKSRRIREKHAKAVKLALAKTAEDAGPVESSEQSSGDSGGTRDLRLESRAIREGWITDQGSRDKLIQRQISIGIGSTSNREATSAFKALVSADQAERGLKPSDTNVNVGVVIQPAVEHDPTYLEFVREKALRNGNSPDLGSARFSAEILDSGSSVGTGPSGDGHDSRS
jgi:hypothetical protein